MGIAQTTLVGIGTRVTAGQVWFPNGGVIRLAEMDAAGSSRQTVTGRPYSADQMRENTAADGTTRRMQSAKLYRDSAGRTRAEVRISIPYDGLNPTLSSFIEIIDPVAGYRYFLDPRSSTAQRSDWAPDKRPRHAPSVTVVTPSTKTASAPTSEMKCESLGSQYVDGVLTEGTRTTITYYPAGGKTVANVAEAWKLPEFKIVVLQKLFDPRAGETTIRLRDLLQSEPGASLFRVPEDDTIVTP